MKSSKEYYSELADGLWHAARGGAMLAVCAGREVASWIRRRIEDNENGRAEMEKKETSREEDEEARIIDAEAQVVGRERREVEVFGR